MIIEKVFIVSDNDHFHCASDEQHIQKIFRKKEDALAFKATREIETGNSYDLLEWDVE